MHAQHAHDEFKHDGEHDAANSTHSVASDCDGTTLSYTCMEKTIPESASTLATSATSMMSL